MKRVAAVLFCAFLLGVGRLASGQTLVTITGRVMLAGDVPVHGATVIIVGARRTATTDDNGEFSIAGVGPGRYEVLAQREHYTAARQTITVGTTAPPPLTFVLTAEGVHEAVTVTASATGAATTFEAFSSVSSLDSLELAEDRGATLTDALTSVPGVAVRSFGAGSARPIIRGFDGDRVLIMQDGVRTGDLSSQSGDHGTSIDPASLERVEVVKGPATLLYGSNALGGVVNAITPQDAFRTAPFSGVLGSLSVDAGTANTQAGLNGNVQYGRGAWMAWAGGGSRRTGDYETPLGPVDNSATRLGQVNGGAGWAGQRMFWSIGGQVEQSRFGIPFAGQFHGHEDEDEPAGDETAHELDVDIDSDRRVLRADAGLRNFANPFVDTLKATFNYTDYAHREIEIEDAVESTGTSFSNRTSTIRAELEQKRQGRLSGRLGVEWLGRAYEATGEEALAPPTDQTAVAAFAYEELGFGRWRAQFGGRVERTAYTAGARPVHEDGEGEDEHTAPPVRDRSFAAASGSVGVHAEFGASNAVVVNLTGAARAPSLEELYNFGPHVGNLAFEIGNPDLVLERTVGLEASVRRRASRVAGEVNAYVYSIRNFVFLDFTGEEVHGLREAQYLQGDSRFAGAEASTHVELGRGVHFTGSLSTLRATLTSTGEPLPRIPPISGRIELEVPWRGLTISPEVILTGAQRRVFRQEPPTEGSTVLNVGASWLVVRGHMTHAITIKAYNLTNEEYRLHTSFIKDLTPEIGRGLRLSYSLKLF